MSSAFSKSVECVEGQNAGMPVKVVFLPYVEGETMQEKKEYCAANLDHIRKMLTYEPRSGSNSYGVVVTKPANPDAHFGVIYFDPSGWHDMCGHASMFLGSFAVRRNLVSVDGSPMKRIVLDTPAGEVTVNVYLDVSGNVDHVSLMNVPSFVHSTVKVELRDYGELDLPVAFGGDFYAMADLDQLGMKYSREILPQLHRMSLEIMGQLEKVETVHPLMNDVRGIYGIRYQSMVDESRNMMYGVLFFGTGSRVSLDRSPSGTSSSAHLAYLRHVRGNLSINEDVEFLSSIDTRFKARITGETKVGGFDAIVPEISTVDRACFITGFSTYVVDEGDTLETGFKPLEPF